MEKSDRPYVIVCSGMTLDGKLSNYNKEQIKIDESGSIDMLLQARAEADAVVVGGNTLIQDDPGLSVKEEKYRKLRMKKGLTAEPAKVAIVSELNDIRTGGDFFKKGSSDIYIITSKKSSQRSIDEFSKLATVIICGKNNVNLVIALKKLNKLGFRKLVVEGGGELNYSMFKDGIVDEVRLKVGNLIAGGKDSVTFVEGEGFTKNNMPKIKIDQIISGTDHVIIIGKVK